MKQYKKSIVLHYTYVSSVEGQEALAKIFDDIFKRIIKRKKASSERKTKNILTNI